MIGLTLLGVGCGNRGEDSPPTPRQADTVVVEGRVRVAGATPIPHVIVEADDGRSFEVRGEPRPELLRLSGAIVRVRGDVEGHVMHASDYRILEIAGRLPIVGTLEVADTVTWIRRAEGEMVRLQSAPPELRARSGSKVWVILDSKGAVKGYGILDRG